MVRFDMSEYQTKESIMRFIGTPDRKISGSLTDDNGKTIQFGLLDEFEKAHQPFKFVLQVFDDGRLTDGFGQNG